jgi:arylsulfatase A-like enzyme
MTTLSVSRRQFLRKTSTTLLSLTIPIWIQSFCSGKRKSIAKRPNIILILADDMGYSDLGCYGSEIDTPNLDRLAKNGIRFSQFYNAARCCPTRASLLTGLYPHQTGIGGMISREKDPEKMGPYQGYLNAHCVTIAEVLKQAGYRTAMSGKWHVGEMRPHWPTDRGFDHYFGLISGAANYFDPRRDKPGADRIMASDDQRWYPPENGFYMTDAITDHAVKYIDELAEDDHPFFLYVAYTAPHYPLHAHKKEIEKYRGKYLKGWEALRKERYDRQVEMGLIDEKYPLSPLDDDAELWQDVKDKDTADLKMAIYAAQIDIMDQGIGKVLKALDRSGKDENTLILFLSDNGASNEYGPFGKDFRDSGYPPGHIESYWSYGLCWANASNTPFRYFKKWIHEGGITTPLIARWPEGIIEKGTITDQPGHIVDIMATCCDIARVGYPDAYNKKPITPLEGKSLKSIFQGKSRQYDHPIFWEHNGRRAVRRGEWKLVLRETGNWELYNLDADRTELNNLAENYPDKVTEMKSFYNAWAQKLGVVDKEPKKKYSKPQH